MKSKSKKATKRRMPRMIETSGGIRFFGPASRMEPRPAAVFTPPLARQKG